MKKMAVLHISCILGLMLSAAPLNAAAAEPDGTLAVQSTSVAAGVGVTWGEGTLTFRGMKKPFSLAGVSLVDAGVSSVSAVGDVYNLGNISDFEGTYAAAKGELTVGAGMGGLTMKNQNGVIINLRSTTAGLSFALGPEGMKIEFK